MEFHSFFQPLEATRHALLSDKMGFHFFELKKLPDDVSEKDALLLWLSLFKAETEEELEKIKRMGVPTMEQAIHAYYSITASPEFRELERLREKPAMTRLKRCIMQNRKAEWKNVWGLSAIF